MRHLSRFAVALAALAAAACGSSSHSSNTCDPTSATACGSGQFCEAVQGGQPKCFDPVVVTGTAFDLATGKASGGIQGARIVALDANRAPAGTAATSGPGGAYTLAVSATRDANGKPVSQVTLRADAAGYQSFPSGVRTALPLDLTTAAQVGGSWTLSSALSDVGLIKLPGTGGTATIQGTVAIPGSRSGVLVVAEPAGGGAGVTAIADAHGGYVMYNLPAAAAPGTNYTVTAYGQGANYAPAQVQVASGDLKTVDLSVANTATATLGGSLIFNSGASTPTSVTLVVKSTYVAALDRGESPPGLVAQVPSGNGYTLTGVPDGSYIALAAFGIDGDVRDLSGGGNTAPVDVVVQSGSLLGGGTTLPQFKLVAAVDLTQIDGIAVGDTGAATAITSATPVFTWLKQSSYSNAATYAVDVYDAFGTNVWTITQAAVSTNTATYAGTSLAHGMYYQLRVRALDGAGNQLSQTEDLKGVFYLQ